MRHGNTGRALSRNNGSRLALFRSLVKSFLIYGLVRTTLHKGKEVRKTLGRLFRRGQVDCVSNRRYVFSFLGDEECVSRLFQLAAKNTKEGFCFYRLLRCGFRKGDSAKMVYLKFCK